jgi:ribosome maturation factor RimP
VTDPITPEALSAIIEPLGYELVDVRIIGSATQRVIRLRIDFPGGAEPGHGVSTTDCSRVSRAVEAALEGAGAVGPVWTLEVSSPGVERPVRFPRDWRRYQGRDVRLKATGLPSKTVGTIVAMPDDEHVTLDIAGDSRTLPLDSIREATLVIDWSTIGTRAAGEK